MNKEIIWNIVNSVFAGLISFLSIVIATEQITARGVIIAACTAGLAAIILFRDFWNTEKPTNRKALVFLKL